MKDISKYQGRHSRLLRLLRRRRGDLPGGPGLTRHLVDKGVKGVYVGGSSGECIYQSVAERKLVLENVVEAAQGKRPSLPMWPATIPGLGRAGPPRRRAGRGRHCPIPHLLPSARLCHRQVLERHERRPPQHRFRHLQHSPSWPAWL